MCGIVHIVRSAGSALMPLVLAAVLPVAVLSCGKQDVERPKAMVSFVVVPGAVETKGAVSEAGEWAVHTLDLLIFRSGDGVLDTYVHAAVSSGEESLTSVRASVTTGIPMTWWIVANAPEGLAMGSVGTLSSLEEKLTYLTDNSSSTMTMHASGEETFDAGTNLIEDVGLIRYACKVTVENILVPYLGEFTTAPTCVLDEIALVNVRGTCPMSGTPTAALSDLWYNRSTVDNLTGFLGNCLHWSGTVSIPDTQSHVVNRSFYAMPNASEGDAFGPVTAENPWTPRRTRIAVRLTIDGVPQWYPVDLPAMVGKTHYVVSNIVVMGPGAPGPDEPIDRELVSFDVKVTGWSESDRGTLPFSPFEEGN